MKPCAYETTVDRIEYLTEHDARIVHILLGDDQRKQIGLFRSLFFLLYFSPKDKIEILLFLSLKRV